MHAWPAWSTVLTAFTAQAAVYACHGFASHTLLGLSVDSRLSILSHAGVRVGAGCQKQTKPATDSYVKAHIANWAKEPFVGGCYSHPSLGARLGDRYGPHDQAQ